MFHKEGKNIILITFFLVVASVILAEYFIPTYWVKLIVQIISLAVLILILQFFRNPKRHTHANEKQALSPVDGKVVVIEEVFEKEVFNV